MQVDEWMPLQVGAESVQHDDDSHAHAVLLAGPLVETGRSRTRQDGQTHPPVEGDEDPQLPGHGQHQVMVGDLQQVVQHNIGPAVGRVLAARGTEARLARVRHDADLMIIRAGVNVTAQSRRPTRANLPDGLQHHRPDPAVVGLEEVLPVRLQNRGEPVADLRADGQHDA
jgi:hypothetical protein